MRPLVRLRCGSRPGLRKQLRAALLRRSVTSGVTPGVTRVRALFEIRVGTGAYALNGLPAPGILSTSDDLQSRPLDLMHSRTSQRATNFHSMSASRKLLARCLALGLTFRQCSYGRIVMQATTAITALAALAHECRLAAYRMLVEAGPAGLPAGSISTRLKVPPSSMTFHLQALQRAALITQQRMSRQLIYAADFVVMNELVGYLTENCCGQGALAVKGSCSSACAPAAERPTKSRKIRRSA